MLNAGLWFLSQIRFRRRFLHRGTGLAVESLSIAECPLLPGRAELARKYDHVPLLVACIGNRSCCFLSIYMLVALNLHKFGLCLSPPCCLSKLATPHLVSSNLQPWRNTMALIQLFSCDKISRNPRLDSINCSHVSFFQRGFLYFYCPCRNNSMVRRGWLWRRRSDW